MRVVVTIDGELLISLDYNTGIAEQKVAITSIVRALENMLDREDQIVICHGNAPQIGTILLRSEAAKHVIYPLPLDVCGADTQGATGYMFQQAIQSSLEQHDRHLDVVTLITQVLVDEMDAAVNPTRKRIGPYFDKELAQVYQNTRKWEMEIVPGFGYQRTVPLLMPERVIETNAIRTLVESGALVICAGGGGIPIRIDSSGMRVGIEAVVDKAYTTSLLAKEINADVIFFVTSLEDLIGILGPDLNSQVCTFTLAELDDLIEKQVGLNDPLWHKLIASRAFLRSGGKLVVIIPPGELAKLPHVSYGAFLGSKEDISLIHHPVSNSKHRMQ